MKILMLCSRVPFPLHDGGNLAVFSMMEGLMAEGVSLSVLSMNTTRHWVDVSKLPEKFEALSYFKTVRVDNKIKPWQAFKSLAKNESYNLRRFVSKDFEQQLISCLGEQQFDIILLEGLFVTHYIETIRQNSPAKICYRQHNAEFEIWERQASQTTNPIKKYYLNTLASQLKSYELERLNIYDCIAAISPSDAEKYREFGCKLPIFEIPYSIPVEKISLEKEEESKVVSPKTLYHLGAMDWKPNQDALHWFLNQVWEQILEREPDAHFHIAGRNMPESFLNGKWKNVSVHGEVEDAKTFERDKAILVVPLQAGGGIRVKILEAMAAGKAVVTTTIGLQGIFEAKNKEHVMVADSAIQFAQACLFLISNPDKRETMGKEAKKMLNLYYNRASLTKKLLLEFQKMMEK